MGVYQKHSNGVCRPGIRNIIPKSHRRFVRQHGFLLNGLADLKGTGIFKDVLLAVIVEDMIREPVRRGNFGFIHAANHRLQIAEIHATVIGNKQNFMD